MDTLKPRDGYKCPAPPESWGKDALSGFIESARQNTLHTFMNRREWYDRLRMLNDTFLRIVTNLGQTDAWFAVGFIPRAHSSYLGAIRLATSGQTPEAYMCMRGCLENALTGFYINQDIDRAEVFLRRDENKESLRKARSLFRPSLMLDKVTDAHANTGKIARKLYDWTIGYGAHPNAMGHITNMTLTQKENGKVVTSDYFASDEKALEVCLKGTASVAVCSLDIFKLILPERFDILGISVALDILREGL